MTPTSQRQVVKNQPNLGALKNLAASKAPLVAARLACRSSKDFNIVKKFEM